MYTIFGITSSAINPIIYGVMNPSYRKAYLKLFGVSSRLGRVTDLTSIKEQDRKNLGPQVTEYHNTRDTNLHEGNIISNLE